MVGRNDDGTTWLETRLSAPPNARVTVTLSFQLWSDMRAAAGFWNVVAVAGNRDPEGEVDFQRIGYTEQKAGWYPYVASWTFTVNPTGRIWVAFGTSVVWEVDKRHLLDYVQVAIKPAGST
jgi:hypothetical protein